MARKIQIPGSKLSGVSWRNVFIKDREKKLSREKVRLVDEEDRRCRAVLVGRRFASAHGFSAFFVRVLVDWFFHHRSSSGLNLKAVVCFDFLFSIHCVLARTTLCSQIVIPPSKTPVSARMVTKFSGDVFV